MLVICDKERWLFALKVYVWLKWTIFLYVILKTLSEIWMIHCYSSDVREGKQDRSLTRTRKRKIVVHWSVSAVCFGKAVHSLGSLCVGCRRFPHLAGQFQEKLSEVTPTTKVREHCTCFCWQTLCRLFVFAQMSLLLSIPKHLFRRDTGIRISVAHLSCQLINFQTLGIICWYVFL